jgi:hypothetical protein
VLIPVETDRVAVEYKPWSHTVNINRAPVLTLWAAVVAERLGYDHEAALTLGKAVAGLNAQSKGRRLGMFEEPKGPHEAREPTARQPGEPFLVSLLHRRVPVIRTDQKALSMVLAYFAGLRKRG